LRDGLGDVIHERLGRGRVERLAHARPDQLVVREREELAHHVDDGVGLHVTGTVCRPRGPPVIAVHAPLLHATPLLTATCHPLHCAPPPLCPPPRASLLRLPCPSYPCRRGPGSPGSPGPPSDARRPYPPPFSAGPRPWTQR